MMYTPGQASQKWCPFARSHLTRKDEVIFSINRSGPNEPEHWCMCMADRCMAWRWKKIGDQSGLGYCGLVGKPEPWPSEQPKRKGKKK
jgi:hypothetical protein